MQLEAQKFLDLVEKNGSIVFWDIESTGFTGDYNSILVLSVKPFGKAPTTFRIKQAGNDKKVVREAKDLLEQADCWVTFYGKGFDVPMLNTRLLKWGMSPLDKRPHIDMYYTLKYSLALSRKSQAHILDWLETKNDKYSMSADSWVRIIRDTESIMPEMVKRCESDCEGLEEMYTRTRLFIRDIKR